MTAAQNDRIACRGGAHAKKLVWRLRPALRERALSQALSATYEIHDRLEAIVGQSSELTCNDTRALKDLTAKLDTLAKPFGDEPALSHERAWAWQAVGYAFGHAPEAEGLAEAQLAAQRVDEIAQSFGHDRDVQMNRASAWRYVVRAHSRRRGDAEGPSAAEDAALQVDAVAQPWSDAWFAVERAMAWREVVYAWSDLPGGIGTSGAKRAALRIEALAEQFPQDAKLQAESVTGWAEYAHALSAEEGASPSDVIEVVRKIEIIAAPYPGDACFEWAKISGWASLAAAYNRLGGLYIDEVRAAQERVEQLSEAFTTDELIQDERAFALMSLIEAISPCGDAELCWNAASKVDQIDAAFPQDGPARSRRRNAWKLTAAAYRARHALPNSPP